MGTVEENKEVVRRIFEDVLNKGNYSLIPDLLAPEYSYHAPNGLEIKSPEGYERLIKTLKSAIPDRKGVIENIMAVGDEVVVQGSSSGTFTGQLMNIEPTGKSFISKFAIFYKFKDGKVIEETEYFQEPSFEEQVGIESVEKQRRA